MVTFTKKHSERSHRKFGMRITLLINRPDILSILFGANRYIYINLWFGEHNRSQIYMKQDLTLPDKFGVSSNINTRMSISMTVIITITFVTTTILIITVIIIIIIINIIIAIVTIIFPTTAAYRNIKQ